MRQISRILFVMAVSGSVSAYGDTLEFSQSRDGVIFAVYVSGACPVGLVASTSNGTPTVLIDENHIAISSASAVASVLGNGPPSCDPDRSPGFMLPALLGELADGHYVANWSFYPGEIFGAFDVAGGSLVTKNASIGDSSRVSGQWYDPIYNGSGFVFQMLESGLLVTYLGWDAAGNRLWLISDIGPKALVRDIPVVINMNYTIGGVFGFPQNNVVQWGSLTLSFSTCEAATASLAGKDGEQNFSLQLLAGIAGQSSCQ